MGTPTNMVHPTMDYTMVYTKAWHSTWFRYKQIVVSWKHVVDGKSFGYFWWQVSVHFHEDLVVNSEKCISSGREKRSEIKKMHNSKIIISFFYL